MIKQKAFTLIELLVVISIIALLVSILMPALNIARQQASGSVCLGNEKSLIMAWQMFSHDNVDRLVGGASYVPGEQGVWDWPVPPWACTPIDDINALSLANPNSSVQGALSDMKLEYRINGLKAGALWTYLETHEVYHCPADTRYDKQSPPFDAYRTYSVTGAMNGEDASDTISWSGGLIKAYSKMTQIKGASEKMVFVEEYGGGMKLPQYNNAGSWMMGIRDYPINDTNTYFIDPLAIWHVNKSTMAFADGHAEVYQCKDSRTIEYTEDPDTAVAMGVNNQNDDKLFFARSYGGIPKR
ncbi:MAG: type II secretion system protein [Sedimentisphaerales bacterium]|nr:type II secretion system protein [Sedimentisphaerales bacterium]